MSHSHFVKPLTLAGISLSLAGIGVPTTQAATQSVTTVTNSQPKSNVTNSNITSFALTADELAEQKKLYGDVTKTLIKLSGTKNTRDLGGYQTADGKWKVQSQRLLRSDNLNKLYISDKKVLADKYHVTSVIDFRTPGQINSAPDQTIPNAANVNLSILGEHAFGDDKDHPTLNPDFSGDGSFYVQRLEFGYPAVTGYRQFLNMLLDNPQATLYHCSSGKDRTGIATVLIMSILGMDQQTIVSDFMQSNQTGRTVKLAWINEYFREIKQNYGTMEKYITQLLDFSQAKQEKLRSMYLVSTDGKDTTYPAPQEPAPAPTAPENTKKPEEPTITAPIPEQAAKPQHKTDKVKVISTKRLHTSYKYHLKGHKQWFKDAKLKKSLGHTPRHSHTKWRLVKVERIKINHKTLTYYQVKDHAGHLAWLAKANAIKIK